MKYLLGAGVIGPFPYADISEDQFIGLRTARRSLLIAQSLEEKFGLVLENFWEYEETRLRLALRAMEMTGHDPFWDGVFLLNRRLVNMLTTCRMYVDQTTAELHELLGESGKVQTKNLFSQQYDSLLGYRVMEALRNYAQHHSFPIGSAEYFHGWEQFENESYFSVRINPKLRLDDLDSGFKKEVLKELKLSQQKDLDVTRFVREYIEGLSIVHKELRDLAKLVIDDAKASFASALEMYSATSGATVTHCMAHSLNEEDEEVENFRIYRELPERVDKLRQRALPTTIARWIVSNKSG
jgi:hypothetical protein